jgi:hypothetical protein
MLMSEVQHRYAQQECIIHSNIAKSDNVVELYHYTESKEEFVLLMEYCNDAGYFEQKIEQVRIVKGFISHKFVEFDTNYELRKALIVLIRHLAWPKSYS